MSSFLTLRAFGALDLDHAATIAGLPASLRLVDGGKPDVAVAAPDLTAIAAGLAAAPNALVVMRPTWLDDAAITALDATTIPVLPVLVMASRLRAVDGGKALPAVGLVRSRLAWHGAALEAMLEHLAGLETVLGPVSDVRMLVNTANGYSGLARTSTGTAVNWSGRSGAARPDYELDIIGLSHRLEVTGELDGSARPLLVRHGDAAGLQQPHGMFETGLRRFWREVVSDVSHNRVASRWRDYSRLGTLLHHITAPRSIRQGDAA